MNGPQARRLPMWYRSCLELGSGWAYNCLSSFLSFARSKRTPHTRMRVNSRTNFTWLQFRSGEFARSGKFIPKEFDRWINRSSPTGRWQNLLGYGGLNEDFFQYRSTSSRNITFPMWIKTCQTLDGPLRTQSEYPGSMGQVINRWCVISMKISFHYFCMFENVCHRTMCQYVMDIHRVQKGGKECRVWSSIFWQCRMSALKWVSSVRLIQN